MSTTRTTLWLHGMERFTAFLVSGIHNHILIDWYDWLVVWLIDKLIVDCSVAWLSHFTVVLFYDLYDTHDDMMIGHHLPAVVASFFRSRPLSPSIISPSIFPASCSRFIYFSLLSFFSSVFIFEFQSNNIYFLFIFPAFLVVSFHFRLFCLSWCISPRTRISTRVWVFIEVW